MLREEDIQKAKDEIFSYQENVGRSYEQALAASGFELGAHWVLNRLKNDGMLQKSNGDYVEDEICTEDEFNTWIDVYVITSMNQKQYLGDIDCKDIIPNKGDIIKIDNNVFEVSKREIDYSDVSPSITLYVRIIHG